ncbi:MAG: transketolase [Coriobacteriales bacterium]|jgi:transketolase|nr:transketolase [Coriobacteriales bacterium]
MSFDSRIVARAANTLRQDIVKMLTAAGSGHPGGSLSAADILATIYFGDILRYRPDQPDWPGRDRFILSKGHAAPVLYATLARAGYFPLDELATLRQLGSRLQGHPDMRKLPGVEVSTGSLGQGLSISSGFALGLAEAWREAECPAPGPQRVFTLLGDGELDEGQVWEAAMFAAARHLDNLVAIVDNNGLQIDGHLEEVLDLGDISAKFEAFGWQVFSCDGNDVGQVHAALLEAIATTAKPAVVLAHTIKGKGVSFMEDQCGWHGKAPSQEQCAKACQELEDANGE